MSSDNSRGKKLVIRLQYADCFQVSSTQLDSVLTDIRKDQNTAEYVCSLASRLNSPGSLQRTDGLSFASAAPTAQSDKVSQTSCNLCRAGSCGIEAIASSPSETYSFYAKSAPRDDDDASTYIPTILVEVYSNEQVNGLQKANDIIEVIKSAVDNNIIKKQTSKVATPASICVLNFLAVKTQS